MIQSTLSQASLLGLVGLIISVGTVCLAATYAIRPRESLLVLMRPVSLAALFGGLTSFTFGMTHVLIFLSAHGSTEGVWPGVAGGAAESCVALVVTFGCLTISWLLIALGLRRGDVIEPPPSPSGPASRQDA